MFSLWESPCPNVPQVTVAGSKPELSQVNPIHIGATGAFADPAVHVIHPFPVARVALASSSLSFAHHS